MAGFKYRKFQKGGKIRGFARRSGVAFGEFGLQAQGRGRLTPRQIESARRCIMRYTKRGATLWIRRHPDWPVSKKPLEVRQGSGKGNVEYYAARIKPGMVLFEVAGVGEDVARRAFELAAYKLPFKVKFVEREWMS